MLKLENITKKYYVGDNVIDALKGISIEFRKSEFVAVLGHSGCGKTTLLNIIGGLDRYTSGKLTIAGRPTEKFSDNDWDAYRNHSVGFVFQTYNLIPHQTVLANVELALTLSGVSASDRKRRAMEALEKVGLKSEAHKKPNQMSGGQMQRVAIARALVNDPEILLADEPTGALDSETSVQIMDILKQIAADRLVIMVTHNPELAAQYATRTVRLSDGLIVSDTDPYDGKDEKAVNDATKTKHTTMSFFTALSLSFNNLMTKKGRTLLTAFAGSIGIIGIALILSLSNGINIFINDIQEDTLASYPVSLYAEEADMSGLISAIVGSRTESKNNSDDRVYVSAVMYDLVNSYNNMDTKKNDLKSFKAYIAAHQEEVDRFVSTIQYTYDAPVNIYVKDSEGAYNKADIATVFSAMSDTYSSAFSSSLTSSMYSGFSSYGVWEEMLCDENTGLVGDAVKEQYTLLKGEWPTSKEELVLFLDENNEITDITLYALGLMTSDEMLQNMAAAASGKDVEIKQKEYSFDDVLNQEFRLVLSADCYTDADNDGIWTDIREDKDAFDLIVGSALSLKITAIVKPNSDNAMVKGSLGYTSALVSYIMEETAKRDVVKQQQSEENKNVDVFTGLPFEKDTAEDLTDTEKATAIREYFSSCSNEEKYNVYLSVLSAYSEDELNATVDEMMASFTTREALEQMILKNYAGATVSEDVLKEYIAAYSDEELHDMVAKAVFSMLAEQVKTDAQTKLDEISSAPSDKELAMIVNGFMAKMPDRTTKIGYVYQDYSNKTTLPAEQIMGYLMTVSDSELDVIVKGLAEEYAKTYYEQNKSMFNTDPYAKVAAAFDEYVAALTDEDMPALYDQYMPSGVSESTLSDNLKALGVADKDSPASIKFYVSTFEDKDTLSDFISTYNAEVGEEHTVSYTDYVGLIMSSVTVIIDAISYVLVAFVSVSLVVSSIMIGIITYISVLERTKEIGILRAIGASRRDISRVFNAETLVIGFGAGLFGVGLSLLLIIPINALIRALSGLTEIGAQLPWQAAVILILISMALTLIAGLFPSRIASKKDPVIALRTE